MFPVHKREIEETKDLVFDPKCNDQTWHYHCPEHTIHQRCLQSLLHTQVSDLSDATCCSFCTILLYCASLLFDIAAQEQ